MSEIPADRHYTQTHEWLRELSDGTLELGITEHAQHALGDLVFVELPEAGAELSTGEGCVVVESTKAASDVYSPVDGEVAAVNSALADRPELVNQDPYGEGWLLRIRASGDLPAGLMDAAAYAACIESAG
ncbi:MAG TPA: glycine cleavage system protein GcvH [Gammaproteobacteria bacterium]|nr:glycine cleavage system protein GcvH [Gammaproteobacteria bacterium]